MECVKGYAIYTVDAQGNVLNWNVGAEHLRGYRAEDILGKNSSCFYTEEDRSTDKPSDNLKIAAAEGRFEEEGWRARMDGSQFWAEVIITPLRDEKGDLWGFSNVTRDISERKQAEDARKRQQHLMATAERLANVGSWEWDIEENLWTFSDNWCRMHGAGRRTMSFEELLLIAHPDDRAEVQRTFDDAIRNGKPYDIQHRIIRQDTGEVRYMQAFGELAADEMGRHRRITGAVQDVTLRRRSEEALRESEQKFSKLFNLAPVGITFSTLSDGKFIEINEEGERLSGYRRDEVIGQSKTVYWKDPAERTSMIREILEKGEVRDREMTFKDKAGRVFWGMLSAVTIEIGGEEHLLGMVSDIDERKRAQDALRESEERFRLLADAAPVLIWEAGPDAHCTFFNKPWLEYTGRNLDQELGDGWMQGVHPDDVEHCKDTYLSAVKDRRSFSMEYRLRRSNGEYGWVAVTGVPRLAPDGDLFGYIGSGFDITEKKRAQDVLQQANELLQQRVAERTTELSDTIEKLKTEINERLCVQDELREKELLMIQQSRLAAMGEMIGNIAHQWRQPLNMLGLLAQDLAMTYKKGDCSTQYLEANVQKVMETINHMSKTIDDFKNFFRPDKQKTDFRILEMIEKTVSLLEGSLKAEQIRTTVVPAGDPVVNGYPNELSQVVLNIMINARDAFVTQHVTGPAIIIEIGTEEGRCVVTITDNAGGIPEEILDKIFDPYFTTKGQDHGTGVGLYMSKTIIEKNMGGTLSACNVDGGAQFRIEV